MDHIITVRDVLGGFGIIVGIAAVVIVGFYVLATLAEGWRH